MVTKSFPRTECRGTAMLSCPPAQRGVGHDLLAGAGIQLMIGFQIKAITSRPDLAGFIQPRLSVSKMPHKSA